MAEVKCPGLPAHWINGWLAAVGVTFLVPQVRLRWTGDWTAVLTSDEGDPVELLTSAWPDKAVLDDLPVAKCWRDAAELKRNVSIDVFVERARVAREHPHSWTLTSTMTDLLVDEHGCVAHAPFDPSAPRGLTLWDRLLAVHRHVDLETGIAKSLAGISPRVKANGLGFDLARLGSLADDSDKWVDPVIEFLAFFGLAALPVRGPGVDQSRGGRKGARAVQRGWTEAGGPGKAYCFRWPAWTRSLDWPAIDALLDVWMPEQKSTWHRVGVLAGWRSVTYRARGTADATRAFGSERL